ncbi:MAG TPA: ribosome small subunit-dependent GTPase A [Flavobacteriales bacterium]|nr:ribosome small subunit-dependent GTPase A [Flavobacteriales bacterium]
MKLEDFGYTSELENYRKEQNLDSLGVGRVLSEHKERYVVKTPEDEFEAEIIGNLRFSARSRSDFPAVGDWVAISAYDDDKVLIHAVFPRKTIMERQAVGKQGEKQIIAANIDCAFIVQAVDRDFNLNRIERYLTICNTSKVKPMVILNKIDLIDDIELERLISAVRERIKRVPVFATSNKSRRGIEELKRNIEKGKTYCLLGSSGVGKSSLLNRLSGVEHMKTDSISSSTNKGRHVTSHRELMLLENGGIMIDNPGMREVGLVDSADGLDITFEAIHELSKECRFKDCTHTTEVNCAVLNALENGNLDPSFYENYLKMEREKDHFESSLAEKRKKDKAFGKMVKNYMKVKKQNKY